MMSLLVDRTMLLKKVILFLDNFAHGFLHPTSLR